MNNLRLVQNTRALAKKLRMHVLYMSKQGKCSHIGSALSIVDILAVLYGQFLNIRPKQPQWNNRDRFILSKGHAGAAVYAVLAELGFFSTQKLKSHYQNGSDLSGHVSHKNNPGVDLSTGSLGHGLGVGVGMAMELKIRGGNQKVVVLLSDGECDEGSNWEAILFAQHHKLDNLIAIIDYNKLQSLGKISETLELEPFVDKWRAFNWSVFEVDGHDHEKLLNVLLESVNKKKQPTVIIAHTIKGKGISFMENSVLWHYRSAQGSEFNAAKLELEQ